MKELQPLIRIALYILAGYLGSIGLPKPAVEMISSDPAVFELVMLVVSALITAGTLLWWRIAKKLGWST